MYARNKYTKAILKTNHDAFAGLHEFFGFDFEKPFTVAKVEAPFTMNKAIKSVDGYAFCDGFAVLVWDSLSKCAYNRFDVVSADAAGRVDIIDNHRCFYKYNLDYFYAKCSFEEKRKKSGVVAYVVHQKKEHLASKEEKPVDLSQRFKVKTVREYGYVAGGEHKKYIGKVELRRTDASGNEYFYECKSHYSNPKTDISDVIDRSGYFVCYKRDDLKRRAEKLRAERAKADFCNYDTCGKVETLAAKVEEKRVYILNLLASAKTSDELARVDKLLDRWVGFGRAVRMFECFTVACSAKAYRSVEDCEKEYAAIVSALEVLQ